MNETHARDALTQVGALVARLVTREGAGPEDAVMVAGALMHSAELIFKAIGGPRLAAEQFYVAADRIAAAPDREESNG